MSTILSLCDLTGAIAEPWLEDGHEAVLVDPQHGAGVHRNGPVTKLGYRIDHPEVWAFLHKLIKTGNLALVAAFPPCTDLAVSGARWFESKRKEDEIFQFRAMQVVWQCHVIAEMAQVPYFIENPVSQVSTFWRKPDYTFHPYQFTGYEAADNYTKKTMLWTGGGFLMPSPQMRPDLGEPDNRIHNCPPSAERANIRSATPRGFARAVYFSNYSKRSAA